MSKTEATGERKARRPAKGHPKSGGKAAPRPRQQEAKAPPAQRRLFHKGNHKLVEPGDNIVDQAGRNWKFKTALPVSTRGDRGGEVFVNNGTARDKSFLTAFFPGVEFRDYVPPAKPKEPKAEKPAADVEVYAVAPEPEEGRSVGEILDGIAGTGRDKTLGDVLAEAGLAETADETVASGQLQAEAEAV